MTVPSLQRMCSAGVKPTVARIGSLQTIETHSPSVSADEVFRQMLLRGTRVNIGTIYRAIHRFASDGLLLLREEDGGRKALYRIMPIGLDTAALRLVCPDIGRVRVIDDAALHSYLPPAAWLQGVALEGPVRSVQGVQTDALHPGVVEPAMASHKLESSPRLVARRA